MNPYYQDDAVTIYHGDQAEVVPLLSQRVDLVVVDPPFFLPAQVTASRANWPRSLGDVAVMSSYFGSSFAALATKLSKRGAFYTFSDSTSYAVFAAIAYPLFDRTMCIVWDKGSGGLGSGWRHSHELVLHGAFKTTVYADGFRRNVIQCKRVRQKLVHASEKPVGLIKQLIAAHDGETVLDAFCGSGSTLLAAKTLGRKAIGIEIEEKYCEIAAKRMSQMVLPLATQAEMT